MEIDHLLFQYSIWTSVLFRLGEVVIQTFVQKPFNSERFGLSRFLTEPLQLVIDRRGEPDIQDARLFFLPWHIHTSFPLKVTCPFIRRGKRKSRKFTNS